MITTDVNLGTAAREEHCLHTPRSGVFEPLFVPGRDVNAGQLAGYLYDQEEPWREPEPLYFEGREGTTEGRTSVRARLPAPLSRH